MAINSPILNDVTTDFDHPPVYWLRPPKHPIYDAAKYQEKTRRGYPDLKNLTVAQPPDALFQRVVGLVRARGWRTAGQDDTARRIQAIAITKLMRFRDDILIEVRAGSGAGTSEVAMRSKSRLGKGDYGANANRIRAFFADLQKA
jgi:hypothetical protein